MLAACPEPAADPPAARPTSPVGSLHVDLPPGVTVTVDGTPRGTTPLQPLELSAAEHRVELSTPCATATQTVVVQPDGSTIDRASASTLAFASLDVHAKTLRDKPLVVKLHAGDIEILGQDNRFEFPACPVRMRVQPTGTLAYNLGSFIEDIDPKPGEALRRDLVLRPGPDVVRLPEGPFRQGPHPDDKREKPMTPLPPKQVVVGGFDMDKTEVTARQFMDCLGEGRCQRHPRSTLHTDNCVFDFEGLHTPADVRVGRRLVEGKEDRPANCINVVEAQEYCEWRGMRLPTPLEFDYAFRSGDSDNRFPWGSDNTECLAYGWWEEPCFSRLDASMKFDGVPWGGHTAPQACSFADGKGTNAFGVCDLAGGRLEFALAEDDRDASVRQHVLGGDKAELMTGRAPGPRPGEEAVGFRCIAGRPPQNENPRESEP